MADYKRMISYMYQYENGVKKKNVGFVRVETKSGQCKITLHMQLLGQLDSIFPTYLIQRDNEAMELIYVGDTVLKNQVMDSKLTAEEENVMNTGHTLSEMGGLLLFLNDNVFFATEWEDKPIVAEEVLEALKPKTIQEPKLTLAQELQIPKYKLPRGYKTLERLQKPAPTFMASYPKTVADEYKETEYRQEPIRKPIQAANNQSSEVVRQMEITELGQDMAQACETMLEEKELVPESDEAMLNENEPVGNEEGYSEETEEEVPDPQVALDLFKNHSRIYPFEDNEILLCVKLEPKDVGLLPKELWTLSNNSFLMHGYYCYHHLIFAKLKDRFGCRYILGVPGIYHNRERFMAKMFGFDGFKPIRKRELRQGDFGYWYLPVVF